MDDELLCQSLQGTLCDGQYPAKILGRSCIDSCSKFNHLVCGMVLAYCNLRNCEIWDSPHLPDLALKDLIKGTYGGSDNFMKHLMSQSAVLGFCLGVIKCSLKQKYKLQPMRRNFFTSQTCSTHFANFQYFEFVKLLELLPVHVKAFQKSG